MPSDFISFILNKQKQPELINTENIRVAAGGWGVGGRRSLKRVKVIKRCKLPVKKKEVSGCNEQHSDYS